MGKIKPKRSLKPIKIKKQDNTSAYLQDKFIGDGVLLMNNAVRFNYNNTITVLGGYPVTVNWYFPINIPQNFKITKVYYNWTSTPGNPALSFVLFFNNSIIHYLPVANYGFYTIPEYTNVVQVGNNTITGYMNYIITAGIGGTYTCDMYVEGFYL